MSEPLCWLNGELLPRRAAVERSLGAFDLYTAGERFLTGAGAELIPLRAVDGRAVGACPGPVFRWLQAAFHRLVERETATARVA